MEEGGGAEEKPFKIVLHSLIKRVLLITIMRKRYYGLMLDIYKIKQTIKPVNI